MKTILIVDDDPLIVQVYRGPLQRGGYQVEVAMDGLAAMKMLLQVRPDVVLLDVLMPKVDGAYVLEYIRSRPELKATKVLVLSDAAMADAGRTTVTQNPDRVFMKSEATPKVLLESINELLNGGNSGGASSS